MKYYVVKYENEFNALFVDRATAEVYILNQLDCIRGGFKITEVDNVNEIIEAIEVEKLRATNKKIIEEIAHKMHKINEELDYKEALSDYSIKLDSILQNGDFL